MARYLGPGALIEDPDTGEVYTTTAAADWVEVPGLRPPAYIVGSGGFGVSYRVEDSEGRLFAAKEYFPRDHAKRDEEGQILPRRTSGSERLFEEGLRRFLIEGQLLGAFDHPNINKVARQFELDGTAYHISPLVEGRERLTASETGAQAIDRRVTLEHYLRDIETGDGVVDLDLLRPVLEQLLDAVQYVHEQGTVLAREITGEKITVLLHRDIKPSNVLLVTPDGLRDAPAAEILRHPDTRVRLIDFGSARIMRETEEVTRTTGTMTDGYSPHELRDNQIEAQGAHTDIYSLGALIWRAFQGRAPTTTDLLGGAELLRLVRPVPGSDAPRAPQAFLAAVDKALRQGPTDRPQSIAEWRTALFAAEPASPVMDAPPAAWRSRRTAVIAGGTAAAIVAVTAVAIPLINSSNDARLDDHIRNEAQSAFSEAQLAATEGATASRNAEEPARRASAESAQVQAIVDEGASNFAQYQASLVPERTHHSAVSGGSGDLWADSYWCHRKGDDVVPDRAYSTFAWPGNSATVYGRAGYSCGVGHTHIIFRQYTGSRSPWRTEIGSLGYVGQVDADGRAAGRGRLAGGQGFERIDGTVSLAPGGSNWTGEAALADGNRVSGAFSVNDAGQITTWTGEERAGDRLVFRGQLANGGRTGLFEGEGRRTFGRSLSNGGVLGEVRLPNGIVWTGQPSSSDARTWGRLEQTGDIYWGEIVNGEASGCGVWDRGRDRAGWYEGRVRDRQRSRGCLKTFYASPATSGQASTGTSSEGAH